MPITLVVSGDLHLGKQSTGWEGEQSWRSTKQTWGRLVDYAIRHAVDLVCLTGDIIDRDNRYFEAFDALRNGFLRLTEAKIHLYMVAGNHDWDVLPQCIPAESADYIHLLGRDGRWESCLFHSGEERIQLLGCSFPAQHITHSPLLQFPALSVVPDSPTLVLLHADLSSKQSRYAPITEGELMQQQGVDGWLLGHIHLPTVVRESDPLILYPGTPHALSPKESGWRGFSLLTITGRSIDHKQIPFSPIWYDKITIDISSAADKEQFRELVIRRLLQQTKTIQQYYHPELLVIDLLLTGTSEQPHSVLDWAEEIREYRGDGELAYSIRRVETEITQPLNLTLLSHEPTYIGTLAKALLALEANQSTPFTERLIKEWKRRVQEVAGSAAFLPLHITESDAWETKARSALITECRRLIQELLNQKRDAN